MGYYAYYDGNMTLKGIDDKIRTLGNDIFENFEVDESESDIKIYLGGYEKYHEDVVYEFLHAVSPYAKNGAIEYRGDDDALWRFIFKNGSWKEEYGRVLYESEPVSEEMIPSFLGQIVDIFDDELDVENPTFTGKRYDNVVEKLKSLMKGWRIL